MRIQHNITALNSYRNYSSNTSAVSKNLEKLSSGYKINRAGDDAAGLAISEKMRAQITGLETATKNAKDGISLVQTAEGALTEVHDMLNRMVELADQSANGTYDNDVDRANLQKEVSALQTEIDRIADSSNFNGIKLLNGSLGNEQVGTGTVGTTELSVSCGAGYTGAIAFETDENATKGISVASDGTDVTITLGTKTDANTYTASDIENAVKEYAKTQLTAIADDAKNGTSNAEITADQANALLTFTASGGSVTLAANDAATTGTITTTSSTTGSALTLQIGESAESFNQMNVKIGSMSTNALGINGIDISTQSGATAAIDKIKTAINTVSSTRGDLGATQNRLEHTINNLSVMTENIQDAESSIRDVDVAAEMMEYTKNNILVQSAQAMLAQANQLPQGVLQLLQ